jgi:aspartyl-tRNA(Asn)/glutamyl-tRNA(Gln) amidotransferase subunit C
MPTPDAANPSAAAPATPSAGAPLSEADVRHVARLARLAIPEGEIHRYAEQLQGILAYVAKIGEVNIEGVEPTAHAIQIRNVLREDVVGPMLSVEEVLQNASESDPPFFKVTKVIGGDEDSAG